MGQAGAPRLIDCDDLLRQVFDRWRAEREWSKDDLAQRAGLSVWHLRLPVDWSVLVVRRLANALGVTLADILDALGVEGVEITADDHDVAGYIRDWRVRNRLKLAQAAAIAQLNIQKYWTIEIARGARVPFCAVLRLSLNGLPRLLAMFWQRAAPWQTDISGMGEP